MDDIQYTNGILCFVTTLLLSGVSSFLEYSALLGAATNLAQGLLDGLSVVAGGATIVLLVRSQRQPT
jgi:hypothetical protein